MMFHLYDSKDRNCILASHYYRSPSHFLIGRLFKGEKTRHTLNTSEPYPLPPPTFSSPPNSPHPRQIAHLRPPQTPSLFRPISYKATSISPFPVPPYSHSSTSASHGAPTSIASSHKTTHSPPRSLNFPLPLHTGTQPPILTAETNPPPPSTAQLQSRVGIPNPLRHQRTQTANRLNLPLLNSYSHESRPPNFKKKTLRVRLFKPKTGFAHRLEGVYSPIWLAGYEACE